MTLAIGFFSKLVANISMMQYVPEFEDASSSPEVWSWKREAREGLAASNEAGRK